MRYYDVWFFQTVDGRRERITVRVVRRKHAEFLLADWVFVPVGPLAIGLHVADEPATQGRFPGLASRLGGRN